MQQTRPQDHEISASKDTRSVSVGRDLRADDYNEVDLRQLIEIVIKRKHLVLGIFIISVISAAVFAFISPRIYEISVVIGPPVISMPETGVQDLDSVGNIKAEIESGAFNEKILNDFGIRNEPLVLAISQPRDSKLIKISLNQTADKADVGKKILAKLVVLIGLNYEKIIEDKMAFYENQAKLMLSHISRKENEIKSQNEQFKILAEKERGVYGRT